MIDELAVTNLGVIAAARIEPGQGLTVLTGETGAGKTLLLGALRLLLGATASEDGIGPESDEARVEGRFTAADGTEFVTARRLVTGGRSRAYLDGSMVPARVLEERAGAFVEVVAQHDRLQITRTGDLRSMLDRQLDEDGQTTREAYGGAWAELRSLLDTQAQLGGDQRALQRELDLVRHQADEIAGAGFASEDEERLRVRVARLRNAASLAEGLARAAAALDSDTGAGAGLGEAVAELRRVATFDETLGPLAHQAASAAELMGEIGSDVTRALAALERDPSALDEVEERLALLTTLKRKYGATLDEVLEFGANAAERAIELTGILERAGSLEGDIAAARERVAGLGEQLTAARRAAGKRLADEAMRHLRDLGLGDATVSFEVAAAEPGSAGADKVELKFSSDRRLAPGPVRKVASGGELSRLVLALRLAGGAGEAPVLVFDEIDAGVGGATALAVGRKLAELARTSQVLCVTHLPQVAAFADNHFAIARAGGAAHVHRVAGDTRLRELSRMLSGLPESIQAKEHADELLAIAGKA